MRPAWLLAPQLLPRLLPRLLPHGSRLLQRAARGMLGALLPAACAVCGMASDGLLCEGCRQQFITDAGDGLLRHGQRCPCCANPLPDGAAVLHGDTLCGRCLAGRPAYDATVVATDYAAPFDRLVLQLKFGGRLALAGLFARLMRDAVLQQPGFVLPELLCPVPLGRRRLAERGFNQALEIARPLATALGVGLYPALAARVRDTPAQSLLAPAERQHNMRAAFAVAPGAMLLVRGCHIGIVDDVMTSGQTLDALAATFKRHGATRVSNLVFARTPPH